MPVPIGLAIAGLGASVGGGLLSHFGQKDANETNARMQQDANNTNIEIARQNREWQASMANTAHQREVADLRAAGLNPILSATGGSGAASPAGNAATVGAARVEDSISKGISSAKDLSQITPMLQNAQADVALKESSVVAQTAATANSVANAKKLSEETAGVKLDNVGKTQDLPARKKEAALREVTAEYDKTAAPYDAIMNRALGALGGFTGALGKFFRPEPTGSKNETLRNENKTMKKYINKLPRRR